MRTTDVLGLAAAFRTPRIAAALQDREGTIQVWDAGTAKKIAQLEVLADAGPIIALHPGGELLAAAAYSKGKKAGVACYDLHCGLPVWHSADVGGTVELRFSRDGRSLYCAMYGGPVERLSTRTGKSIETLIKTLDVVESPHWKRALIDCGRSGFIVEGAGRLLIPRLSWRLGDAAFSPDSVCISEPEVPVRCFDLRTGTELWQSGPLGSGEKRLVFPLCYHRVRHSFYGIEYSLEGEYLLVRLDPKTGKRDLIRHMNECDSIFCCGGDWVVDATGGVFDTADGHLVNRLRFPTRNVKR
jgi:WD40 repeat protein